MRLLVYNIRYATGTGPAFHLPVPGAGYLRSSRKTLDDITQFIRGQDADLVGLIEVDTGSMRSGLVNQVEYIAKELSITNPPPIVFKLRCPNAPTGEHPVGSGKYRCIMPFGIDLQPIDLIDVLFLTELIQRL